jgi:hypothetical protein
MADDQWVMYDGFSDKGAHSIEWFQIAKYFPKLVFAGNYHEGKCLCNRCQNRRIMSEFEMTDHIVKQRFMLNYMVWHQHGEVQASVADESHGNNDENQIDNMIVDIDMEYDLGSGDQHPPPEVQNFFWLLAALDEKMHDNTDLTILQAVTHLMVMKSKYNISNQSYNDIMKLIIDLIAMKHNMSKDFYQSKRLLPVLV